MSIKSPRPPAVFRHWLLAALALGLAACGSTPAPQTSTGGASGAAGVTGAGGGTGGSPTPGDGGSAHGAGGDDGGAGGDRSGSGGGRGGDAGASNLDAGGRDAPSTADNPPPPLTGTDRHGDGQSHAGTPSSGHLPAGVAGFSFEKSHMSDGFFMPAHAPLIAMFKLLGTGRGPHRRRRRQQLGLGAGRHLRHSGNHFAQRRDRRGGRAGAIPDRHGMEGHLRRQHARHLDARRPR